MKLPAVLAQHLESVCGADLLSVVPVSGGCISNAVRAEFARGRNFFLKWAATSAHPPAMFSEEARSLRAIDATRSVRVPAVVEHGERDGYAWLLLEWLEPGPRTARSQAVLGEQLASMHRSSSDHFGWPSDNFIGSLPQSNRGHQRWPDFWRAERLLPQLELAGDKLHPSDRRQLERLADRSDDILGEIAHEPPGLLHGDLWGGNLHIMSDGTAAVIDPSSYYGHREVDLAMSRLFGGFSEEFYLAYQRAWPSPAGLEQRLLMYQLYYLLVHVNLFGGGYAAQTMRVAGQLGS